MNGNDIIALGLGLQAPWEITRQQLDTSKKPARTAAHDSCRARYAFPLSCLRQALSCP